MVELPAVFALLQSDDEARLRAVEEVITEVRLKAAEVLESIDLGITDLSCPGEYYLCDHIPLESSG
jgi:hypothetical protein